MTRKPVYLPNDLFIGHAATVAEALTLAKEHGFAAPPGHDPRSILSEAASAWFIERSARS